MQNGVLLFKPLVTDVSRYTCLISKLAHRVDKIAVCPKFSAPELLYHLRVLLEYLPGCDAFQHPDEFTCTPSWDRLNQKMNMILIRSYFEKMNIVSFLDLKTHFLQRFIDCFAKNHSLILSWTNKMIQQYTYVVKHMYVFAFAHTYKDMIFTPQGAGN